VLARYNPNGLLDPTFGSGGIVTTSFPGQGSYAFAVALQSDGNIIAAGVNYIAFRPSEDSSNTGFALARYNPDGSPDSTFGNGGQVRTILTALMTTPIRFSFSLTVNSSPWALPRTRLTIIISPLPVI
jgi:uncharacterized delta-60 repeat protein